MLAEAAAVTERHFGWFLCGLNVFAAGVSFGHGKPYLALVSLMVAGFVAVTIRIVGKRLWP